MTADSASHKPYRLPPAVDAHREESSRMILQAADTVPAGRAIVLGAGPCDEIPLSALVDRFQCVLVNDQDGTQVDAAIAKELDDSQRAKVETRIADLTGQTDSLVTEIERGILAASDIEDALARMVKAVNQVPDSPSPLEGTFDLVVASCLLCQLHVAATQRARAAFIARFKDQENVLLGSSDWQRAIYQLARRMEATFVDRLVQWTAPTGRVFLSETVQMCYVELSSEGDWLTEGTYRMTKSTNLLDYLDSRFHVEAKGRWNWVVNPPQKPGDKGRLFDVQAVVLSLNPTS